MTRPVLDEDALAVGLRPDIRAAATTSARARWKSAAKPPPSQSMLMLSQVAREQNDASVKWTSEESGAPRQTAW